MQSSYGFKKIYIENNQYIFVLKGDKMDKNLKMKIVSDLKKSEKDIGNLLSQLIKFKTENPPVDNNEIQRFIKERLEEYGAQAQIHHLNHKAVPLTSSLGKMDNNNFILYGHADVVPAGDLRKWKYDPFSGKIIGNRIYGRGAVDMKGGLAAAIAAFGLLTHYDAESQLAMGVSFVSVLDEENWFPTDKGYGTSKWLLETGKLKGNACIMGEPTALYKIIIGERGDYWIKLTCISKPRHGSFPVFEKNPNIVISNVLNEIYSNVKEIKVTLPSEIKDILLNSYDYMGRDLAKIEAKELREDLKIDELKKMLYTPSMNVGTLNGGTMINIVPDRSESMVAFTVPIGMKRNELHNLISGIVAKYKERGVSVEPTDNDETDPTFTLPTSNLVTAAQKAVKSVLHNESFLVIFPGTSDGNVFRSHGIDTCFAGPGNSFLAHTYNECVSIKDIVRAAEIYVNSVFGYNTFFTKEGKQ
jgi:succinyl-diaminopimelate desuccinylase